MFPKELDGAKVLFFTPRDNYGTIEFSTGGIAAYIHYLAICKYENDYRFYLFSCDEEFNVEGDTLLNSVEECMSVSTSSYGKDIHWIKAST
jgi:hypothetical protein